ncbi:MAG: DUF2877 domain-containing protein [Anaerolineales bacterium]
MTITEATSLPQSTTYLRCSQHSGRTFPPAVQVRSLSVQAWDLVRSTPATVRVLGRFRRTVDLLVGEELLALVLPDVGNGPFHVVVEALPPRSLPQTLTLQLEGELLTLGAWRCRLPDPLSPWDPRPSWSEVRFQPENLKHLLLLLAKEVPAKGSSPFDGLPGGEEVPQVTALRCALESGDREAVVAAAELLAGWGPGLTPSGDDFLAGVMLALHYLGSSATKSDTLAPATVSDFAYALYEAAAPRTNRVSRAFLAAARDGLADERWHRLLQTVSGKDTRALRLAVRDVLAFGATSGRDMLGGFLWLLRQRLQSAPEIAKA